MPLSSFGNLLPFLLLFLYIYIYINFIYVYIWSEKNILKVEFLINKTPSNTDLLPKTTGYHQRLWNICWKFFRFVHALFVLVNDLFVLFWVLKKFCRYMLCIFFFLLWIYALSLHARYIYMFKSHFNLWQKIVRPPFLYSSHFGLRSDFFKFKHDLGLLWNWVF